MRLSQLSVLAIAPVLAVAAVAGDAQEQPELVRRQTRIDTAVNWATVPQFPTSFPTALVSKPAGVPTPYVATALTSPATDKNTAASQTTGPAASAATTGSAASSGSSSATSSRSSAATTTTSGPATVSSNAAAPLGAALRTDGAVGLFGMLFAGFAAFGML